jgi:glycosyltransferase involved in cell wall biosynthesis
MKIDYFHISEVPSSFANAVTVVKTCAALAENGAEVTLLCRDGGGSIERIFESYGVSHRFPIERITLSRLPGIGSSQFRLMAMRRMLRSDATVYTREIGVAVLGCALGKTVGYEYHAFPRKRFQRWLLSRLTALRSKPRIVSITSSVEAALLAFLGQPRDETFHVVPCGADLPLIGETAPAARMAGLRVGYVGHLFAGKGANIILGLARRFPGHTFEVVGRSGEIGAMEDRPDNIVLHGVVPHAAAMDLMQAFDIVLAPYQRGSKDPSGTDLSESFSPVKLFEYMAAAKPIICSDLPVLREVMTHEENGLLVEPGDLDAWSEGLTRLAGDPALRRRLALEGRARVEQRYSYAVRARRIIDILAA